MLKLLKPSVFAAFILASLSVFSTLAAPKEPDSFSSATYKGIHVTDLPKGAQDKVAALMEQGDTVGFLKKKNGLFVIEEWPCGNIMKVYSYKKSGKLKTLEVKLDTRASHGRKAEKDCTVDSVVAKLPDDEKAPYQVFKKQSKKHGKK